MNDLISRHDAIETIRKLQNAGMHWFVSAEAVFDALLKLPSAQTEQMWIPCEERPPEESGLYLTKDSFGSMRKRWYSTVPGWEGTEDAPTAWMPLSESV